MIELGGVEISFTMPPRNAVIALRRSVTSEESTAFPHWDGVFQTATRKTVKSNGDTRNHRGQRSKPSWTATVQSDGKESRDQESGKRETTIVLHVGATESMHDRDNSKGVQQFLPSNSQTPKEESSREGTVAACPTGPWPRTNDQCLLPVFIPFECLENPPTERESVDGWV